MRRHNYHATLPGQLRMACLVLLLFLAAPALAIETQDLFKRYQNGIVQIHILEASSGSRVAVGSGFSVSRSGKIVTNYHVISELVQKPEKYRAEIVYFDGHASPLKLLNFDAVHDLAIVSGDTSTPVFFELNAAPLPQGTRAYSIGTPLDLGFTIVEGTYNGLLVESQYERIHFTGSINSGMSGGPTILDDGRVIGVNVATAGDQVSFLVRAKFVMALLQQTRHQSNSSPSLEKLASQLQQSQSSYMADLLAPNMEKVTLGQYLLPGKIAPYLNCWGHANTNKDDLFQHLSYDCSSDDDLYVSSSHSIHFLRFNHDYISSEELGQHRFFKLYQSYFAGDGRHFPGAGEDVTKFRCHTNFVKLADLTVRAVLCVRSYKKLPELYDAVLKIATLRDDNRGVLSTVELGGVSFDNIMLFSRKYMENIAWKK